jgi:hypothetical protein
VRCYVEFTFFVVDDDDVVVVVVRVKGMNKEIQE